MKTIMTQLYATFGIDDTSSNMRITSFTEDGNQLVININSDRDPGVFYLFNRGLDGSSQVFVSWQLPNAKLIQT